MRRISRNEKAVRGSMRVNGRDIATLENADYGHILTALQANAATYRERARTQRNTHPQRYKAGTQQGLYLGKCRHGARTYREMACAASK